MDRFTPLSSSQSLWLRIALILTTICLAVGLFSPMMTMSKFYFFESSFSVIGGVHSLLTEGHLILAVLVFLFSVVLPLVKLFLLFRLTTPSDQISTNQRKLLGLMHDYGRWAMLDVMVVAVLLVTVKLGAVASIQIHWGLYVFGLAVVSIMFLTHKLVTLLNA
ncbi:paraquat-inducible protein A [Neptuniibacter sp. QD72_48]|uniref:paraquat-inducible protein A n=1 Tax=Neptuniibacter sp. QD72_48 TaxID=3398214 RepID=UPI0039F53C40